MGSHPDKATQIDGGSGWTQFINITLPLISPVIFYNLVLSVIQLMQYFTIPYVMTSAGINNNAGDPNNAAFGLTTSQRNNPRDIQLGVKFIY